MDTHNAQISFLDNETPTENIWQDKSLIKVELDNSAICRLSTYTIDDYCDDVERFGMEKTWSYICRYMQAYGENENGILQVDNFGEMYELGLATTDKQQKKENGQYYTPKDVAQIMSEWLDSIDGHNICDVGCGTGKLILTYFDVIGAERAREVLSAGRLYLYDNDKIALNICKTAILIKYGIEYEEKINDNYCDFLDRNVVLPDNSKVISNPPYSTFSQIQRSWDTTEVISSTKELYSAFMEKILLQSKGAVVITPYSFIGGAKFYPLRRLMNNYNGFILSFDNVPGNIFNGKKHGVFNTNTSNSVRAAITVVQNKNNLKGFRLSHLIRFKNEEREELLKCRVLEEFISPEYQTVCEQTPMYYKCDNSLTEVFDTWTKKSKKILAHYASKDGRYYLCVPNTCRYFTVASNQPLNRSGKIGLRFTDKDVYNFVFCMLNSSFAYWHWRLYDGGITYTKGLLLNMPVFFDLLTEEDKRFFENMANEMIERADEFIVRKNNVGVQENIKYPKIYRDKINKRIFEILQISKDISILDVIHSNTALEGDE